MGENKKYEWTINIRSKYGERLPVEIAKNGEVQRFDERLFDIIYEEGITVDQMFSYLELDLMTDKNLFFSENTEWH